MCLIHTIYELLWICCRTPSGSASCRLASTSSCETHAVCAYDYLVELPVPKYVVNVCVFALTLCVLFGLSVSVKWLAVNWNGLACQVEPWTQLPSPALWFLSSFICTVVIWRDVLASALLLCCRVGLLEKFTSVQQPDTTLSTLNDADFLGINFFGYLPRKWILNGWKLDVARSLSVWFVKVSMWDSRNSSGLLLMGLPLHWFT